MPAGASLSPLIRVQLRGQDGESKRLHRLAGYHVAIVPAIRRTPAVFCCWPSRRSPTPAPDEDKLGKAFGFATGTGGAPNMLKASPRPNQWRTYDSADTIRFYTLRLNDTGMIKSSPQKILAQGADLRFLNELKKELKG
jgi:hypothetical protein